MKTLTVKAMLVLTIGAAICAAGSSAASAGGFKVKFGGGHGHHGHHKHHGHHHHGHHHHKHYYHGHVHRVYVKPAYVAPVAPCIHPYHSYCFVYPGDTWSLLSQREYGKPNFGFTIAAFNGLSSSVRLVVGQQLRMPVIHPDGSLTPSSAPAAEQFVAPSQPVIQSPLPIERFTVAPQPQPSPVAPAAIIRQASREPSRPAVAVGSELMLDGQSLGDEKGSVMLRVNGLALPVDVLDWSNDAARIRMPSINIDGATKADIEVVRADGSLASRTAIELTPAATRLALGN